MGFIKYTLALMFIALFSMALITFATNFAFDNSAELSLGDDGTYTTMKDNLTSDLGQIYDDVQTADDAYSQSTISSQTEATEGGTQFKVTPATSLSMAKNSISAGWSQIFGKDSGFQVVSYSILAALGFIMIMYAYKAWVGRNPD